MILNLINRLNITYPFFFRAMWHDITCSWKNYINQWNNYLAQFWNHPWNLTKRKSSSIQKTWWKKITSKMSLKTFDTCEISHISFFFLLGLCFTSIHRRILEPKLFEDMKQFWMERIVLGMGMWISKNICTNACVSHMWITKAILKLKTFMLVCLIILSRKLNCAYHLLKFPSHDFSLS